MNKHSHQTVAQDFVLGWIALICIIVLLVFAS